MTRSHQIWHNLIKQPPRPHDVSSKFTQVWLILHGMNLEHFGFIPPMKLGFVTVFQTSLSDSRSLFKQTNEIRHMLSDAVCGLTLSGLLSALLLCLIRIELSPWLSTPTIPAVLLWDRSWEYHRLPFVWDRAVMPLSPLQHHTEAGGCSYYCMNKRCTCTAHWDTLRKRYKHKLVCSPAWNHTWVSPNLAQAQLFLGSSVKFYSGAFLKTKCRSGLLNPSETGPG